MILKYLKEFFVIAFSMAALMLFGIFCIALILMPWFLSMYLEMQGASVTNCFLLVILMYAIYYVVARSFGLIDDLKSYWKYIMNISDLIFLLYFLAGLIMTLTFAYYLPECFIIIVIGLSIYR